MNARNIKRPGVLLLSAFFTAGLLFALFLFSVTHPEYLVGAAEHYIRMKTGLETKIGTVQTVREDDYTLLSLSDISIGSPGAPFYLTLKTLTAELPALEKIIKGGVMPEHVKLIDPCLVISAEKHKRARKRPGFLRLPEITIINGTVNVIEKSMPDKEIRIEGTIGRDAVNLSGGAGGGSFKVSGRRLNGKWCGDAGFSNVSAGYFMQDMTGDVSGFASARLNGGVTAFSMTMKTSEEGLAFAGHKLPPVVFSAEGKKTADTLTMHSLSLRSAVLNVGGRATAAGLTGISTLESAEIGIEISSEPFDYENVVRMLPSRKIPSWLDKLLNRQIAGGRPRLAVLRYKGKLADLSRPETIPANLYVELDIAGSSFRTGDTDDRLTDVSGRLIFTGGDIWVNDLTGKMGESVVSDVDLHFRDVMIPGNRVSVNVEIDMPAVDFTRTWWSVVEPEYVHSLLGPLKNVTDGRVAGDILVDFDDARRHAPLTMKGWVSVENGRFHWEDSRVEGFTGRAEMGETGTDAIINASCSFGNFRDASIHLDVKDLFGDIVYTFEGKTKMDPEPGGFRFSEDAGYEVSGKGWGGDAEGEIRITTNSFSLGELRYDMKETAAAEGRFRWRLWPEAVYDFRDLTLNMKPYEISLSSYSDNTGRKISAKGVLDMGNVEADSFQHVKPCSGNIRFNIGFEENRTRSLLSGDAFFDKCSVMAGGRYFLIEGPLLINDDKITTHGITITSGAVKIKTAGSLFLATPYFYKGIAEVDGLVLHESIGRKMGESGGYGSLLDRFAADVMLKMKNMIFYNLPVEKASGRVSLNKGIVKLHHLKGAGKHGKGFVSGEVDLKGGSGVNLNGSFDNVDIRRIITDFYSSEGRVGNRALVEGFMSLKGNLKGRRDSLNGEILFKAENGYVSKLSVFSKIFGLLNVYKIINTGNLDLTAKGFPYNSITCTLRFEEGIIRFDDFLLSSNSLQMSAVGEYDPGTGIIDAVVGVQPLETIDRMVGFVPVVGWVLTGDNKKLVVVSLKVSGDIKSPEIDFAPFDTFSRPFLEGVLRVLKLPGKLVPQK